jgi:hypothetical protein
LVIIESIAGGLEALMRQPDAAPIKGQLDLLRGLVSQAAQTVEEFGEAVLSRTA